MNDIKYGDPDWKKNHPPDRKPSKADKLMVLAVYQKTEDMRRAAEYTNLSLETVDAIIDEASEKDPRILTSKHFQKQFGRMLKQASIDMIRTHHDTMQAMIKEGKVRPLGLVKAIQYTRYYSDKLIEDWAESKGGEVEGSPEELQAEIEALEREQERFHRPRSTETADSTKATEARAGTAGTMGVDA